eukprot:1157086-Pelagomonas_calceolata.AAC.9
MASSQPQSKGLLHAFSAIGKQPASTVCKQLLHTVGCTIWPMLLLHMGWKSLSACMSVPACQCHGWQGCTPQARMGECSREGYDTSVLM